MKALRSQSSVHLLVSLLLLAMVKPGAASLSSPSEVTVISHTSPIAAQAAAVEDGALILLIFGADWCPPCQRLKKETLVEEKFLTEAGPLHLVYVDSDVELAYAAQYQVSSIPDLLLLSSEMKIIRRSRGFMDALTLLQWLTTGRQQQAEGKWHGIALDALPSAEELAQALSHLTDWIHKLGDAQPAVRAQAASVLSRLEREQVLLELLPALDHPYLGIRLGVNELLRDWASGVPTFDPWAERKQRSLQSARLQTWWIQTRPEPAKPTLTKAKQRSLEEALHAMVGQDPVQLTDSMARLVSMGPVILPRLRKALEENNQTDQLEVLRGLEDVRWAILIPSSLEAKVHARFDLARSTSEARQAAASRLGQQGKESLVALQELLSDFDPLVQESALHALGGIQGQAALAAIASGLRSADSNLRMVAAEVLGQTKSRQAAPYLALAVGDPDELVACTALAALEECQTNQPEPLLEALTDPRWRVRATSAEVIGKLKITTAIPQLNKLLEDNDPFVVKTVLDALLELKSLPNTEVLLALLERYPTLAQTITKIFIDKQDPTSIKQLVALFGHVPFAVRQDIVAALLTEESDENSVADWLPLLRKIATDKPALRQQLVQRLQQIPHLAGEFIAALLGDEQPEIQQASVGLVLQVLAKHSSVTNSSKQQREYYSDPEEKSASDSLLTHHPALPQWHQQLGDLFDQAPSPLVGLAYWLSGDQQADLPPLTPLFKKHPKANQVLANPQVAGLVLQRLPWPAGRDFLLQLCHSQRNYANLLQALANASAETNAFLTDPERLVSHMELALDTDRKVWLKAFIQQKKTFVLLRASIKNKQIVERMLGSKQGWIRALGLYVLAHYQNDKVTKQQLIAGSGDLDPWVRYAAIQAITLLKTTPPEQEAILALLLEDPQPQVVKAAAMALLAPNLQALIKKGSRLADSFRYAEISVAKPYFLRTNSNRQTTRPITPQVQQPKFLVPLKQRLARSDPQTRQILALVLGQYGDYSALDQALARWHQEAGAQVPNILLAALLLSKNEKYLAPLRQKMAASSNSRELMALLKWLRGLQNAPARALRREINHRIWTLRN